jgi:hypothetical protein
MTASSVDISWIAWALSLVISTILIVLSWFKSERRWSRIISTLVLLISLFGIYLKPTWTRDKQEIKYFITSPNHLPSQIDSLITSGFVQIKDISQIDTATYLVQKLVIIGDGLSTSALEEVTVPLHFISSRLPEGLVHIDNPGPIEQNATTIISGSLHLVDSLKLQVSFPGGIDVVDIQNSIFNLNIKVPITGYHLLEFLGVRKQDTLFTEKYPINVVPHSSLSCLLLTGFPTAETKHLKNFLSEQTYKVAVRQNVSRDMFQEEFLNMDPIPLIDTRSIIDQFDLLFMDADMISLLDDRTIRTINQLIEINKLGVIFLGPPNTYNIPTRTVTQTGELSFFDHQLSRPDNHVKYHNLTIGGVIQSGLGKKVYPYFKDAYKLLLQDKKDLFDQLWNSTIETASPFQFTDQPFLLPDMGFKNVGADIGILAQSKPKLFIDSTFVEVSMSDRPGTYFTRFWPGETGWLSLQTENDQAYFYVADDSSWQTKKRFEQHQTNRLFDATHQPKKQGISSNEPISPWFFYALFLISAGYLWLESRI